MWGEAFLRSGLNSFWLAVGMAALMQPCHAASTVPKSGHTGVRHIAQQHISQKSLGLPCYRSQAGLIFLKGSPRKGHLGHSNSFAPIGEAVFRSSADQHACILEHGRRG